MPVLSFIALVSSAAVTAGPPDGQTALLTRIFESTCLDREMKLSVNDARPISYDKLPKGLPDGRERAGEPLSANVWLLNTPGRTYLYILRYREIPGIAAERICGLASDKLNFEAASDWVLARSNDQSMIRIPIVWNMREGYVLEATLDEDFSVLQANWAGQAEREKVLKNLH